MLSYNSSMRTALDLMTPNLKTIASGDTLEDVIKLFLDQGVTSSPVKNPLGETLGVFTELSLLKAFMLHKAKFAKSDRVGHHVELFDEAVYIDAWAPLSEVLKVMIQAPNHRLLVRDEKLKIIGIISPKDIMRAMLGVSNPVQNIKEKLIETEERLKTTLDKISEIEKHLEVYRNVFQETPYMVHAADAAGKIIMSNRSEHEALGYKMGELIGMTIYDLYAKAMHGEAKRGLELIKEKGFHHMTYTTLLKKDGSSLRCDIVSSALRDKNGEFLSTLTVLRPVDSEELLRTLNGIVNDADGPLARYVFNK